MSAPRPTGGSGFSRLNIARAVSVMAVLVIVAGAAFQRGGEGPRHPPPGPSPSALAPVASEANVFSVRAEGLSIAPDFVGNGRAHARSPELYRRLRAYPGAPPRIPHGLTREEFEGTHCTVCHERGGWVARFGSYAPVTPHPEWSSCLQCHVPSDDLVGRPRPSSSDALVCSQCHGDPDASPPTFSAIDWRPAAWPMLGQRAMEGSPHLIPHGVESRNNCLACHAGPGTVVGLRTDHPERLNCRQCHVPMAPDVGVWPDGDGGGP